MSILSDNFMILASYFLRFFDKDKNFIGAAFHTQNFHMIVIASDITLHAEFDCNTYTIS